MVDPATPPPSDPRPDISVVVPAFDEVGRIGETLDSLRDHLLSDRLTYQIIVVVDGTDGTDEVARSRAAEDPAITVIGGPNRRGKGRSVREGVALAKGEVVGFIDADGKTDLGHLAEVLAGIAAGDDLVIGSRTRPGAQVRGRTAWYRRAGSRGFSWLVHRLVGLHDIGDTQCGFKFARATVAHDLFARLTQDGYLFDVELLALAERQALKIGQVPVVWSDDGDSRSPVLRSSVGHLADLIRIRRAVGRPPADSPTT